MSFQRKVKSFHFERKRNHPTLEVKICQNFLVFFGIRSPNRTLQRVDEGIRVIFWSAAVGMYLMEKIEPKNTYFFLG